MAALWLTPTPCSESCADSLSVTQEPRLVSTRLPHFHPATYSQPTEKIESASCYIRRVADASQGAGRAVNMHVLEIDVIKSLPQGPMSHSFVERLIGIVRREPLDRPFICTVTDLENKLREYQGCYNKHRTRSGRGRPYSNRDYGTRGRQYRSLSLEKHCRGLLQPVAAGIANSPVAATKPTSALSPESARQPGYDHRPVAWCPLA